MSERIYIAIDLKSFYASVECVERGLDPLTAHLVVADQSRTDKTICLAVSPALKAFGIPGRPRLFEVVARLRNTDIDYIVAPPRLALYLEYSNRIYSIYLRYIAPEDIHVYSIDEVFMDVTAYLNTYQMTAHELAMKIIRQVLNETGITATVGIGTNMYLAKIAMDIVAKKMPADRDGVRIAELDEMEYRRKLWDHTPLTDFWRVGRGYAKKLTAHGLNTMGDIARCSIGGEDDYYNEDLLYKLFGVNAQLLIDHAWGWEPVTIADIRAYRPAVNSISSGQVLQEPYTNEKACIIVREMADALSLDMVDKGLVCDQIVLTIGYDIENLTDPERARTYNGEIVTDHYGRKVPKHAHGTYNLGRHTSSTKEIIDAALSIFERTTDPTLLVRRVTIVAGNVVPKDVAHKQAPKQLSFFSNDGNYFGNNDKKDSEKERRLQEAQLAIKKKYGKNAILKGTDFLEGATGRERNSQIGGHKA